MCLHQWQDQYNLHEKGITSVDMRSLQASLKAIEHVCMQEEAHAQSGKKASQKSKAGTKRPSTGAMKQVPKKAVLRSLANYARSMGARIPRMPPRLLQV
jgi:hypothetical protein